MPIGVLQLNLLTKNYYFGLLWDSKAFARTALI